MSVETLIRTDPVLPQGLRTHWTPGLWPLKTVWRFHSSTLAELWLYRDLLFFWARREVSVRYRNTVLGIGWAVIQPMSYAAVFWYCFYPKAGDSNFIHSFIGSAVWLYFSKSVLGASASLVLNSKLIGQVRFPRLVIPLGLVIAGLLDFSIALILILLVSATAISVSWANLWAIPGLIALTLVMTYGLGAWLGALHVRFRDVGYALSFAMQLLLFLSPVIYPLSAAPPHLKRWAYLNPLTGIIEGFRSGFTGDPWNYPALGVSIAFTIVCAVSGTWYFRRLESDFSDLV